MVVLSTIEAEHIGLTEASKEDIWLRGFINEIGIKQGGIDILRDNQSEIHLFTNSTYLERTKHINTKILD